MRSLILFTVLPITFTASAQDPVASVPYSIEARLGFADVPTVQAPPFDPEAAQADDAVRASAGDLPLYGRFLWLNADLDAIGSWRTLPNGDGLWRARIVSAGAQATELFLTGVHLPDGAEIHVYAEDAEHFAEPLDAADISASGRLCPEMVFGEACIVEYREPAAARGEGRFTLTKLAHAYRNVIGESEFCEVDVNCSEGNGWEEQRDAVVRIRVVIPAGTGWCTGSVMNNTGQDCRPFVLTAFHCGDTSTDEDFEDYQFRFRYQYSGCATGAPGGASTVTGCFRRADSNDGGGASGSDFLLVEMDQSIPDSYNAYYAGWDATNSGSQSGKGIHHPASDVKKISTYDTQLYTTGWGISNTHWRVVWQETTNGHGVTEPGSSGSPLFNSAKRVIGTLTGGFSCCTVGGCDPPGSTGPNQPDHYGKMSHHWNSNPNPASEKLRMWLAPNSSATTLDGSYDPCGMIGIKEPIAGMPPDIFPNPSSGLVTVSLPAGVDRSAQVEVTDVTGRLVHAQPTNGAVIIVLDSSAWPAGTYFITTISHGMRWPGGKMSIER